MMLSTNMGLKYKLRDMYDWENDRSCYKIIYWFGKNRIKEVFRSLWFYVKSLLILLFLCMVRCVSDRLSFKIKREIGLIEKPFIVHIIA